MRSIVRTEEDHRHSIHLNTAIMQIIVMIIVLSLIIESKNSISLKNTRPSFVKIILTELTNVNMEICVLLLIHMLSYQSTILKIWRKMLTFTSFGLRLYGALSAIRNIKEKIVFTRIIGKIIGANLTSLTTQKNNVRIGKPRRILRPTKMVA